MAGDLIQLDKSAYELLGVREMWTMGEAVNLLTCIEMEVYGYYKLETKSEMFEKIYRKYWLLLKENMLVGNIPYVTDFHPSEIQDYLDRDYDPELSIREFKTTISKAVLLNCLKSNEYIKLNVDQIMKYLQGNVDIEKVEIEQTDKPKLVFEYVCGVKRGTKTIHTTIKDNSANVQSDAHEPIFDDIDAAEIPQDIRAMDVPTLRKKVRELSDEKVKWDKSIAAAARVGLLFYEKDLVRPATANDFKDAFRKYLDDLPGTTITRIFKSLPVAPIQYKKTGEAPTKQPVGTDDDTIDLIIEASTFAGYLAKKEGVEVLEELEGRLAEEEYEVPTGTHLVAIIKGCKKVIRKYV